MSVDVAAVPPWKRELLEKKRKHDEDEKKRKLEEEQRIAKMPAWKRDILAKKQHHKNSSVFIGRQDLSPRQETDSKDSDFDSVEELSRTVLNHAVSDSPTDNSKPVEEHLIPIQQNPWVRTELHRKRSKSPARSQNDHDPHYGNSIANHSSHLETDGHVICHVDGPAKNNDLLEDVFNEEEVHYGRGFVHKLRQRFAHLSTKEEKHNKNLNLSPKRSRSTDNILDDVQKPPPRSISTSDDVDYFVKAAIFAPSKTRSMENLLNKASNDELEDSGHFDSEIGYTSKGAYMGNDVSSILPTNDAENITDISYSEDSKLKQRNSEIYEEELPRANIVSATRSLFESSRQKGDSSTRHAARDVSPSFAGHDEKFDGPDEPDVTHKHSQQTKDSLTTTRQTSRESSPTHSKGTIKNLLATGTLLYTSGDDTQEHLKKASSGVKKSSSKDNVPLVTVKQPTAVSPVDNGLSSTSRLGYQGRYNYVYTENTDSIIDRKNQHNHNLSLNQESSPDPFDSLLKSSSSVKKRPAPVPPVKIDTREQAGLVANVHSENVKNSVLINAANETANTDLSGYSANLNVHSNEDGADKSPSYKDLYFPSKSSSSKDAVFDSRFDFISAQESVVDDEDEHLLKKTPVQLSSNTTPLVESTDSGIVSDSVDVGGNNSGASSNGLKSQTVNSHIQHVSENKRPTPPNSLPEQMKNFHGETRKVIPPNSINIAQAKKKKVPTATLR